MVKHFKTIAVILSVSLFSRSAYANGVAVIDAATQSYFRLDSSVVTTSVENEIAITTIRNVFTNTVGHDTTIVLAYPSNYLASSTNIRWSIDAGWQNAQIISQAPSDTLPRSGPTDSTLTGYLGYAPFIFSVPGTIPKDSSLTVEYSYVELLLYSSGVMLYTCHNNYVSIQGTPLAYQGLTFEMVTQSTIDTLVFFGSQTVDWLSFTDHAATVMTSIDSSLANEDYLVAFSISLETTGVFDYSTFMDAVNVPDEYRGFFLLKVLPFYDSVLGAIPKNFILMIDRSGSMSDDSKMEDIKLASMNIISNLNVGDHFNIVEFSDGPGSFRPGLVPFTETTRDAALAFINNLDARGGTNISGAFEHVLPMYADADSASANLIMFLSDGEPTSGITDTPGLLADINQLVQVLDDTICIYTLATSDAVDRQFCTSLSMEHHGFTVYVDTSDVISSAENFYAAIRYPVLIDPQLTFSPADVLVEIHPELVPNFFQGSQVLVSGRYTNPSSNIMMSLSGIAFSRPIADDYFFTLSDTAATQNQFLMKIWAKQKIESLLTQYYLHPDDAVLQQELQNQMVWLSVNYGVISPFTSMGPPSTPTSLADDHSDSPKLAQDFELFGNYPNPYNASTTIQFKINQNLSDAVTVNIYNTLGQLVRVLTLQVNHTGTYGLIWDGLTSSGLAAPSGTYIYTVTFGNTVLGGQMSMIK